MFCFKRETIVVFYFLLFEFIHLIHFLFNLIIIITDIYILISLICSSINNFEYIIFSYFSPMTVFQGLFGNVYGNARFMKCCWRLVVVFALVRRSLNTETYTTSSPGLLFTVNFLADRRLKHSCWVHQTRIALLTSCSVTRQNWYFLTGSSVGSLLSGGMI